MPIALDKTPRIYNAAYADAPTGGLAVQRIVDGPADERPGDAPALLWVGFVALTAGDALLQAKKFGPDLSLFFTDSPA